MTCQILAACHLFECAGAAAAAATLKLRLESCIISPSSLGSLCAKLHWKMDFLASDAVRPRPWKTLCTATPAMRVILKGWRGYMSVEAGLWSCLPASDATARTVFNNNVDALAPFSPFSHFSFLFSSVCLPYARSLGFIPSPVSSCDNGVRQQTVFIPD